MSFHKVKLLGLFSNIKNKDEREQRLQDLKDTLEEDHNQTLGIGAGRGKYKGKPILTIDNIEYALKNELIKTKDLQTSHHLLNMLFEKKN